MADIAFKDAGHDYDLAENQVCNDDQAELRALGRVLFPELASVHPHPAPKVSAAATARHKAHLAAIAAHARVSSSLQRNRMKPPLCPPDTEATTINAVSPITPDIASQQGISGIVRVAIELGNDSHIIGTPTIVSSPSPLLNDAAIAATEQSTFRTGIKACHPVHATFTFTVEFITN